MKYLLFLILGIVILIYIIFNNVYEGFQEEEEEEEEEEELIVPLVKPSPVRQDNTCSDPDQKSILDRFDYTVPFEPSGICPEVKGVAAGTRYERCNYNGQSNCIVPCIREDGWTTYSNDPSLCVRIDGYCKGTADLSNNIYDSWSRNCSVIYKQYWNLTSTIRSISSVTGTINEQFVFVDSNMNYLSNGVYSNYDCLANSNKCAIRDLRYPAILSNYVTLNSIKNVVNRNYIDLSNKHALFSNIYSSFSCDQYST